MPTELRYGRGDINNMRTNNRFCVEEPKDVLGQLYKDFRIHRYRGIFNPFFDKKPHDLEGLAIVDGTPPRGTTITGKLSEYEGWLNTLKLKPTMSKSLIVNGLAGVMQKELTDQFTKVKGKLRNYLELSTRERKRNMSEDVRDFYEIKVATFKEIVEVTLDIQDPTEEDLRDILAGKNPRK